MDIDLLLIITSTILTSFPPVHALMILNNLEI